MKLKSIMILLACMVTAFVGKAQLIGDDFTVKGAIAGTYATTQRNVTNNMSDTFFVRQSPFRNGLGFELELEKTTGNVQDSVKVYIYGTKIGGVTTKYNGGWAKIDSFETSNLSFAGGITKNWRDYNVGRNRPVNDYTAYLFEFKSTATGVNTGKWRLHMLMR